MCDSDKEVEDIKTEENVENDEASTETEDCEKKGLSLIHISEPTRP